MQKNDTQKQLAKALEAYYKETFGKEFIKASNAAGKANFNIYFGPGYHRLSEKQYFLSLDRVKAFVNSHLSDCYVDLDCDFVSFSEPEGYTDEETGEYIEPYTENTYHLTGKECARMLFGECASYL